MQEFGDLYQSADWKTEKHVPAIECPEQVKPDEFFQVTASIGKAVAHPNTTEHHIRRIQLVFKPDTGPVYTNHSVTASMKLKKSGVLYATSFCNIHGLWENEKSIKVT